jgi:hypothetical protein
MSSDNESPKFSIPLEISVKNAVDEESKGAKPIEEEAIDIARVQSEGGQKQEQGNLQQYESDNALSLDKTEEQAVSVFPWIDPVTANDTASEPMNHTESFMER